MIRILIADDHTIVREGLKQILAETSDMMVADEATNGLEALDKVARQDFNVVLLDISMPGRNGLDVLRQLKAEHPGVPVLILSMYSEEQYAMRALRAGAAGYLTKDSAAEELILAIRKISSGRKYLGPSLAEKLAVYLEHGEDTPLHETLSDREFQVMCLIASGKAVKEIGNELNLSVKTISTYRTRILEKMRMKTNAALTHYVIQNRLIE
ncbi:MAG: response regulator transcription factor [Nitrospiraceae bacterium]|nr:response regulator transcription factor [Nitrospiraceae bacterium]